MKKPYEMRFNDHFKKSILPLGINNYKDPFVFRTLTLLKLNSFFPKQSESFVLKIQMHILIHVVQNVFDLEDLFRFFYPTVLEIKPYYLYEVYVDFCVYLKKKE